MAGKNVSVFGIYASVERAEHAVDALVLEHFSNDDVSVLMQDNQSAKDFAHEKQTKAPEGTATGVAAGGCWRRSWVFSPASAPWPSLARPFIAAGPSCGALADWSRRSRRRPGRRARRHGHSRIRGQAV